MRLPHVIWDMGGILYRYFTELMVEVGEQEGWPLDTLPLGPTGRVPDSDYEHMLEGGLDEPEYLVLVKERLRSLGLEFDPITDIGWEGRVRSEVIDLIADIDQSGHRQAILTNDATRWLGPDWWETWPYARHFEAMVDVATVGVRKPAPEPYMAVSEALGVPLGDCLFIDDMPVNIDGAEVLGMEGFVFEVTDPVRSVGKLRARLGL